MNRYQKVAEVNDFSNQFLPVRLIQPPFFNYVTSIIRYTLETKDNVTREVKETEKEYYLKLTIDEGVERRRSGSGILREAFPFSGNVFYG